MIYRSEIWVVCYRVSPDQNQGSDGAGLFFFKLIFIGSIVALQCCVINNFYYIAKGVSYTYTYILPFVLFLPI